jgi:nickel superoxide dismutase
MNSVTLVGGVCLVVLFGFTSVVSAHCQIPCGIYDDEARFGMLNEHITTIEKSMNEITRLSQEPEKNYNQIVRWVNNKGNHASEFTDIVTYYFMAQRIKPADPKDTEAHTRYIRSVTLLHQMVVYAMKTKQSMDLANIETLRSLVDDFEKLYFPDK